MKKTLLAIALGLVSLNSLVGCKGGKSGDTVNLKFNFNPGDKFRYTMDTRQVITQSMMGQQMVINQDILMQGLYDVQAGDKQDNRKLTVMYDRVSMKTGMAGMSMEYDSQDSTKQDPNLKSMGGILNKPFSMIVSQTGEITRVEGLSEMLNSMVDPNDPNAETVRKNMEGMMNDSSIRSMMQQSFNIYPDKPVAPGDTWKRTMSNNIGFMVMNLDNEYKLVSVNNGIAHIEVKTTITSKPGSAAQSMGMQMDMSGTQNGTMDVEVANGMITESKMKQDLKGKVSVQGQSIPMDIKSDVHVTGKKI